MDLTSKKVIKNLLKKHKVKPLKRMGQNFLISKPVLEKIIKISDLKKEDTVLEVGPGIGTLTKEIAKKVKKVIAVEKDKRLIKILKETLKDFNNVEIIQKDILNLNINNLISKQYKVVSNLPYYLSSALIRKFLEEEKPELMVLMLQKEVAKRLTAKPPKMNLLAVSVQFYSKPQVVSFISKNKFWPQPEVDSAIVKIKPLSKRKSKPFFKVVKAGFSHPRKQLVNNLSNKLELDKEEVRNWLTKNNINPKQRAETLTIKDWIKLSKCDILNQ